MADVYETHLFVKKAWAAIEIWSWSGNGGGKGQGTGARIFWCL